VSRLLPLTMEGYATTGPGVEVGVGEGKEGERGGEGGKGNEADVPRLCEGVVGLFMLQMRQVGEDVGEGVDVIWWVVAAVEEGREVGEV